MCSWIGQFAEQAVEVVIKEAPSSEDVRVPMGFVPRIACVVELPAGEAHLIDGATGKELGDIVLMQPNDKGTQRRTFGVGFEEVVILHTLKHDEPVPVFPDKEKTIRDVHTLNARKHLYERLLWRLGCSACGGGGVSCCHNEQNFNC